MACWVIGYGGVQVLAPKLTRRSADGQSAEIRAAALWIVLLGLAPLAIIGGLRAGIPAAPLLIGGLALFGLIFAVNSAIHSYLILAFSEHDGVTVNVGFYYMANAAGRLLGTLLSGLAYQWAGLQGCLIVSAAFIAAAAVFTFLLRPAGPAQAMPHTAG
jgi:predicted MFS family arabinose efflux permease